VADWCQRLLSNLEDPTVSDNVQLITDSKGKAALEGLLASRELPEPIEPTLLKALQEVLQGLEKVVLTEEQLRSALTSGGWASPVFVDSCLGSLLINNTAF